MPSRPIAALVNYEHFAVQRPPREVITASWRDYASRDDAITKLAELPYRTGSCAQTVVSPAAWATWATRVDERPFLPPARPLFQCSSPTRTPQRSDSLATMPRPRP